MQIKEPVVCGIASLGMDHMEILGKPLQNIHILLLVLLFSVVYKFYRICLFVNAY